MVIRRVMSEEDFRSALARRLRSCREEKNLTRAQLADLAGVAHRAIVTYELGTNTAGSYNLYRLASALRVDPSELLP